MLIKKIAHNFLGTRRYLSVTSSTFLLLYRTGILKAFPQFHCHYYVKKLIAHGDHIIDIGANLGYFSTIFARSAGSSGKVHSVEPVGLYREILEKNTRRLENITILPFALGESSGIKIKMGIPKGEKHLRHGLMRVIPQGCEENFDHVSEAEMRTPDELFGKLDKCDYIKCDVEGYEMHILPEMSFLFKRFHPILQVETSLRNKNGIMDLLRGLGYKAFCLENKQLKDVSATDAFGEGDIFFIRREK